MRIFFIISLLVFCMQAKVITFSPLPVDKELILFEQYKNMLQYLESETGYKFKFVYSSTYKKLIENFKDGKIDIIELGPLPYVKLKSSFKDANAFLTFKSKNGKPYYSCKLVTTEKDITNFSDITNKNKVILTRRLSTCGYLMSEFIMQKHKNSLKNFDYQYVGTHSDVLLSLLLEDNTIGTVKSTMLDKYKQFKFKELSKSPNIPGFAFVSNIKTVEAKVIKKIEKAILKLEPLKNKKDKKFVSKWSNSTKYGAIKTKINTYAVVSESINNIPIPKEKGE